MFGVKALPWETLRDQMVTRQLQARGIQNTRVLEAMRRTPRHLFVPDNVRPLSYDDRALSVGHEQTISQPYMVGIVLQALGLKPSERVLEVGTGTGYQAALLGQLAGQVETVELVPELAHQAETLLQTLGLTNVTVHVGDGSLGLPQRAPYDAIVVAAAAPHIPVRLLDQLTPNGRLLIPIGERHYQRLMRITKRGGSVEQDELGNCTFVPLVGEDGWPIG
jgi:protein-L-isoaspartate(D-aspartate) O-methyltransferase